uniref:Peroxisomal biogenesis factor 11 n=1 Tax=Kalanchoe fedtschenkoi TaxID=63787 RepID=A0A7N0U6J1_KALFE
MSNDTVDKLVIFLAKRDGIDKLVKTFQYVSKLTHWRLEASNPSAAARAKNCEVASGLSRKAFRTGRFLTGFNALRRNPGESLGFRVLSVLANSGEMVYFFFDHFLWLARVGVIDANLARRMSFVSAFGESFGYVFFIVADLIFLRRGLQREREIARLKKGKTTASDAEEHKPTTLNPENDKSSNAGSETETTTLKRKENETASLKEKEAEEAVGRIRADRVMRLMAVAANVADLIIGLADIEPNPFCNHAVTLGISGLVSAWAGWYRNWPT